MDVALGKPTLNRARVARLAAEAAAQGAGLLVLPELWSTGYDLAHAARHATGLDAGMFAAMAELARTHGIDIVGSCLARADNGRFTNTALYVDAAGRRLGTYSKVHLFRLMGEDQYLTAGNRLTRADAEWGRAGLAICYDLRFPELFRRHALAGATAVLLPAEWPHPRLAHWQTLLRGRAIENQMFMIACNRVGTSQGTTFCGHSCIIDPWGEVVVEAGEEEVLLVAEIDLERVTAVRSQIPIFRDRRPDVYEAD